jgi:hypothetical protein
VIARSLFYALLSAVTIRGKVIFGLINQAPCHEDVGSEGIAPPFLTLA